MIQHTSRSVPGFTLVEVLVTSIIIIVLATITTLSYEGLQANGRDNTRKSNASTLAASLEKYYRSHGEYPSTSFLIESSSDTISQKLGLIDKKILVMPNAPTGTTNSLTATESSTTKLAYNGKSVDDEDSAKCEAPSTTAGGDVNGGCDSFTLAWVDEGGDDKSIDSLHKERPKPSAPPTAPEVPTVSITSGATITATATTDDCAIGSLEYKLDSNTTGNLPDWSGVSWSANDSKTISSPVAGNQYYFFAIARCVTSDNKQAVSDVGQDDVFYAPADAPTTAATFSGSSAVATVTTSNPCPSGTTAKYYIQYRIDTTSAQGAWTVGNNWTTASNYTTANATSSAPRSFNYRSRIRCDSTSGSAGSPSSFSGVATIISAPAAPSLSIVSSTEKDSKTWQWSTVSCPVGTTTRYLYSYYIDNGVGWYPWPADSLSITTTYLPLPTNYQGYEYRVRIKAACTLGAYKSAWGANSNDPSYVRAVDPPGPATNFTWLSKTNFTNSYGDKAQKVRYYWTIPICGLGTYPVFEEYYFEEERNRANNALEAWGKDYTTEEGYLFSTNSDTDDTKWRTASTTASNLRSYYKTASSVSASDVAGWLPWLPNSSDPIILTGGSGVLGHDKYFSKHRTEVRYACRNFTTNRYAVGPAALSPLKTWSGP